MMASYILVIKFINNFIKFIIEYTQQRKEVETMKCVIYIRVGSIEQLETGSVERQIEACKRIAEEKKMEVVSIYSDIGFSGNDINRPELKKLLKDSKKKVFDTVVIYNYDRLTRNHFDLHYIIHVLKNNSKRIECALETNLGSIEDALLNNMFKSLLMLYNIQIKKVRKTIVK